MKAETQTIPEPQSHRGPVRALTAVRGCSPVWGLNLVVLAAAAAVFAGPVSGLGPVGRPHLAWWTVTLAFGIAESCVVHTHFRRGGQSFTLGDIVLAFGLIFVSASGLVLGFVLANAVVLAANRKQPPVKFFFNIAQFALGASIAVLVVQALAPADGSVGPRTWGAVLVATQASGLVSGLLIASAISLSEGWVRLRIMSRIVAMGELVNLSTTSLGLCGAVVIAADPRALPLLALPAATLFVVYRAYLSERERHKRLELLYEANRTLARSREIAGAIERLLARSLEAFRTEVAEIILFGSDEDPSLRTLLGPGNHRELMEPVDAEVVDSMRELIGERRSGAVEISSPFGGGRLQRYLETRGVTRAIVAPLPGDERPIGTIMIANRLGAVSSFDGHDLRLLDTLASNASVALQYDRLEQSVQQFGVLQQQLQHQAYHDPLTGLANRALFIDGVGKALGDSGEVAVLFIDLDDFKAVNDSLGHAAGDQLLTSVASRLRSSVRPQDLAARLGGDEFAVMVHDPADADSTASAVARRILDAFVEPIAVGPESVSVRVSIGIAASPAAEISADELIRHADLAMYRAKTTGKGRLKLFDPSMGIAALERHGLKEELRHAIERRELTLYFQPIVALGSREPVAAEALVHWDHPRRGLIGPSEFVPLAEETGLILSLGQYVLDEACKRAAAWRVQPDGKAPARSSLSVHLDLSAVELRDPSLVARVKATLAQTGLKPEALVFEITETQLLDDSERVTATLQELRTAGVRFAMDDFGTGHSSLSYLQTLPIDTLKISESFVDGLGRSGRDASFLRIIIELARTLKLGVVAEGIETEEQAVALAALGCDYGQGLHLGRPRPAAQPLWSRLAA